MRFLLFLECDVEPHHEDLGTKRRAEDTVEATKAKATKVAKGHKSDDVTNGNGAEKVRATDTLTTILHH